eukprot:scaffold6732_cov99-Isochrysis_galbana.AAC.2
MCAARQRAGCPMRNGSANRTARGRVPPHVHAATRHSPSEQDLELLLRLAGPLGRRIPLERRHIRKLCGCRGAGRPQRRPGGRRLPSAHRLCLRLHKGSRGGGGLGRKRLERLALAARGLWSAGHWVGGGVSLKHPHHLLTDHLIGGAGVRAGVQGGGVGAGGWGEHLVAVDDHGARQLTLECGGALGEVGRTGGRGLQGQLAKGGGAGGRKPADEAHLRVLPVLRVERILNVPLRVEPLPGIVFCRLGLQVRHHDGVLVSRGGQRAQLRRQSLATLLGQPLGRRGRQSCPKLGFRVIDSKCVARGRLSEVGAGDRERGLGTRGRVAARAGRDLPCGASLGPAIREGRAGYRAGRAGWGAGQCQGVGRLQRGVARRGTREVSERGQRRRLAPQERRVGGQHCRLSRRLFEDGVAAAAAAGRAGCAHGPRERRLIVACGERARGRGAALGGGGGCGRLDHRVQLAVRHLGRRQHEPSPLAHGLQLLCVRLARLDLSRIAVRRVQLRFQRRLEPAPLKPGGSLRRRVLASRVEVARRRNLLEGDLGVVVNAAHLARPAGQLDPGRLELAPLLQRRQPARLLEGLLARLALGLLAARVGQARARLGEHLLLVLVHVDGVGPRRLRLGVRVDLSRPEPPWVVRRRRIARVASPRRLVEQPLVVLQALRGGPADDRGNCTPLRRHQLGQVQQLFLLIARPLRLLDRRVEPLVPARFALLGRLADQQRRDAAPLVLAVLHDCCLEDLILRVLPHATLDQDAHRGSGEARRLAAPCSHARARGFVVEPPRRAAPVLPSELASSRAPTCRHSATRPALAPHTRWA